MGGAESVVRVLVAERRQRGGEAGVVRGFAGVEAEVLEDEHFAGGDFGVVRVRLGGADRSGVEADREAEEFAEPFGHRADAQRRVGGAAGAAEVGGHDHSGAGFARQADGGEGGAEAEVVGDGAVLEGRVQVGAEEQPLSREVEVGQPLPAHRFHGGAERYATGGRASDAPGGRGRVRRRAGAGAGGRCPRRCAESAGRGVRSLRDGRIAPRSDAGPPGGGRGAWSPSGPGSRRGRRRRESPGCGTVSHGSTRCRIEPIRVGRVRGSSRYERADPD